MQPEPIQHEAVLDDDLQIIEPLEFAFGLKRRAFVQLVATGQIGRAHV